ncbi:putative bZIP transcription factor [Aspergillus mulundensis]|uniref:BZIP domain-containing protein n=1 Tax=Aspergillus mulundensis TaxID=1810919 RepID=A0A3D8RYZ0_9EURO|nr:hypothetical protein DSM5745_05926 [Aspergillus mulundensis]RDW79074.1 hypothetical protein DSM5745_05926 [Aspergillus mulundensis]
MYHNTPKTPSYYMGGVDAYAMPAHHPKSHPALDLGEESRLAHPNGMHWSSPHFAEQNLQFLSTLSPPIHTPTTDDVFSFPSTSTESSPHMSHLAVSVSDRQSTSAFHDAEFGEGETVQKTTLRRSQNRQAQRRFRERKEAQKTELLSRLDELQAKHDAMAKSLESMRSRNDTIESDKRRLEKEVESLRKWREKILGVMADIVRRDGSLNSDTDELMRRVESSCSPGCWRKGMEYERSCIVMQTLLGLFGEGQGQGPERYRCDTGDEGRDSKKGRRA